MAWMRSGSDSRWVHHFAPSMTQELRGAGTLNTSNIVSERIRCEVVSREVLLRGASAECN